MAEPYTTVSLYAPKADSTPLCGVLKIPFIAPTALLFTLITKTMNNRIDKAEKALFVMLCLLMAGFSGSAQSAKLTVENYTDFDVQVVMHGYSPQICSTGTCSSTYITNAISVPRGSYSASSSVWGPYNPCNIASSPGWNTVSCGVSFCSSVPGDFQWTYAEVTCFNPLTTTPATY